MLKEATILDNKIQARFRFPFGDERFNETKDFIKTIPGRQFNETGKYWEIPKSKGNAKKLINFGFKFKHDISEWLKEEKKPELKLDDRLFPFQKEGVQKIEEWDGRCILGDEMGLGKTMQVLSWLNVHPEIRPTLIIVPHTLKYQWLQYCAFWLDETNIYIGHGKKKKFIEDTGENIIPIEKAHKKILILNYDIIANKMKKIKINGKTKFIESPYTGWVDIIIEKLQPKCIILDEAHKVKDPRTFRTKAIDKIIKSNPNIKVLPLTGTPIENRPIEFYTLLKWVRYDLFPSRFKYAMEYCDAKHNGFGWNFSGAKNTKKLNRIVTETCLIRRKKKDVLTDLPDKTRQTVLLKSSKDEMITYNRAKEDLLSWLKINYGDEKAKKAKKAQALVQINHLKQLAWKCKEKDVINWISDFFESDEKLGIFCEYHEPIDAIYENFKDIAVKLDGRTSKKERKIAIDRFQNDPKIKLFIGSLGAASVGIDLFSASNCAIIQLGWKPGQLDQAEDRFHRIGQKNAVTIYYLLAKNTIEISIAELIDKKRKVIEQVIDGQDVSEESLLTELIKKIRGE